MSTKYHLTGIEGDLRRKFKSACAHLGITMKESFIKHMKDVVSSYEFIKPYKVQPIDKKKKGGKK